MKALLGKSKLVRNLLLILPLFIIIGGVIVGIAGTLGPQVGAFGSVGVYAGATSPQHNAELPTTAPLQAIGSALSSISGADQQAATVKWGGSNLVAPTTIVLSPNSGLVRATTSSNVKATSPSQSSSQSGSIEFFSNLTLQVSSPQSALTKAAGIAYSIGGYVAFSSSTNSSATAVLRVPASEYQNALIQVEAIGNVTNSIATSNDVTIKYTDMNATLQSLLTERDAFVRLLNQSTRLNTTIAIEGYLQGVNAQINSVQSEILQARRLIDYATITTTFTRGAVKTPLSLKVIASPLNGATPLSVTFRTFEKGGVPGYIVNYNFGDGTAAQGEALIHTYTKAGDYNTTISVTDSSGNVKTSWVPIHVSGAPVGFDFAGFTNLAANLFFSVIQGIVEVAIVVIPITLVAALAFIVIAPIRSRLRSIKASNGKAA
ncbi:MAG: DUF4349 domain-containing protein [Thaumarchaeota archaeon]|nr:MAG: DUF4349 domain-containing protein [Nitrososphaerota archaeon]